MGRRIKIVLLFCAAACLAPASAQAAGYMTAAYNIEQARGQSPTVKAYINGRSVTGKNELGAKVSGTDFSEPMVFTVEGQQKFSESKEGTHFIVLLDNSRSVDGKQFDKAKQGLIDWRKRMSGADRMDIYTVGADAARGEKKRVVHAEGRQNLAAQIKAIGKIRRTKNKTVLYRSLNQVLAAEENPSMRTVVLIITDGEDDSQGKNNRSYQINSAVRQSAVPIYGLLLKNVSRKPNREKIKNTTKNILDEKISRGYYEDCDSPGAVKKGFQIIRQVIMEETWVASMREQGNSNRVSTNARLTMTFDGVEVECPILYSQVGEEDTQPPEVEDIKKKSANSITFSVRDDKTAHVLGADDKEHYSVKDEDGKNWKISRIIADTAGQAYELVFEKELYSGEYSLQCHEIMDDSQEQNEIEKEYKFSFEGLNRKTEEAKGLLRSYWWVLLISIVLVIGIIVITIVKCKQAKAAQVNTGDLVQPDSKRIRLVITDGAGQIQDVELNVEGSIFVGRSQDTCNIFFPDDMLSRQHFAIEVTKVACYIEDLQTTNSTFVNGVKISGRRMLSDGDVIVAGREKFVFHMAGETENS